MKNFFIILFILIGLGLIYFFFFSVTAQKKKLVEVILAKSSWISEAAKAARKKELEGMELKDLQELAK